jgi:hypothetical protein
LDEFYIAPEWLEMTRGSACFYPNAGSDHEEPLAVFQDHAHTFWFCDIAYPRGLDLTPVFALTANFRLVQSDKSGAPMATMEERIAENGRGYRFLQPSKLTEIYERTDGRRLIVVRRRGFGQIALSQEFASRSIGIFMHRGDSPGESGSNVYFLANKKSTYEPCGNLFAKVASRLKDLALIISDGSNTSISPLRRFHRSNTECRDAFSYHQGRTFEFGGFVWACVGWLTRRFGPTLVWGVKRQAKFSAVAGNL